jgi:hypothetical protein
MTQFQYDFSMAAVFLDRWPLEMHSFHLPIGEMTVSLQDVAVLFDLPRGGLVMGAIDHCDLAIGLS